MRLLRLMFHMHFGGSESVFLDFLGPQSATGQAQRIDACLQRGQVHARVD